MSREHLRMAKCSWRSIHDDKSRHFRSLKKANKQMQFRNSLEYFKHLFYTRLFDLHPWTQAFFASKHPPAKKAFLSKMISMTLLHLDEEQEFAAMFEKIAEKHNNMGVRAVDYAIFSGKQQAVSR